MEYRQTQWGGFGFPVLVAFAAIFASIVIADFESSTPFDVVVLAIMTAALIVGVVFCRLTVTVTRDRIVASFLLGRPRRVIELVDVAAVRQVRNLWWHGLGIRKIPGGWMHNVWGFDAVELELTSSEVFRLGSNDPEALFNALSSCVAAKLPPTRPQRHLWVAICETIRRSYWVRSQMDIAPLPRSTTQWPSEFGRVETCDASSNGSSGGCSSTRWCGR